MSRSLLGSLHRIAAVASPIVGAAFVIVAFVLYAQQTATHFLGDAYVYLAAGERLNAGHALYQLSAGDRPVPIQPPFWTSPLVSPPVIAVLWRPLAALPNELGVVLWWLGALVTMAVSTAWLVRTRPVTGGLVLATLSIPLAMEMGLGNVNGYLLGGAVAVWALRDRPLAGAVAGTMAALKVWPVVLLIWIAGRGNWRAAAVGVATLIAWGAVTVVGAGWNNVLAYAEVAQGVHPSAFSLTWLLGLPWLWTATLVALTVTSLALRASAAMSFRLSVLAMVFGTPVANPNTYALLLALLVRDGDSRGGGSAIPRARSLGGGEHAAS